MRLESGATPLKKYEGKLEGLTTPGESGVTKVWILPIIVLWWLAAISRYYGFFDRLLK